MRSNPSMALVACLISLPLTLAGCGTTSAVESRVQFIAIPPAMLKCKAEPAVPADPLTDVKVAKWEVDLMAAGCDCRDRLAAVEALQAGKPAPPTTCTMR